VINEDPGVAQGKSVVNKRSTSSKAKNNSYSGSCNMDRKSKGVPELLRAVFLRISREGPDLADRHRYGNMIADMEKGSI